MSFSPANVLNPEGSKVPRVKILIMIVTEKKSPLVVFLHLFQINCFLFFDCRLSIVCLSSVSPVHRLFVYRLYVCILSVYLSSVCPSSVCLPIIYLSASGLSVICLSSASLSIMCLYNYHLSIICMSVYHLYVYCLYVYLSSVCRSIICLSIVCLSVCSEAVRGHLSFFNCAVQVRCCRARERVSISHQ